VDGLWQPDGPRCPEGPTGLDGPWRLDGLCRFVRTAHALLALLALASCGRSAESQAREARAALRSWDATLELTERERARGAIPEAFAAQVRRAADEERPKLEAKLRTPPP
jgi:hypothetical protein